MGTMELDMNKFREDFSFENLRLRMSDRLHKVRLINNPEEPEKQHVRTKEEQKQRQ